MVIHDERPTSWKGMADGLGFKPGQSVWSEDERWARGRGRGLVAEELSPWRRVYVSNGKVTIRYGSGGVPDA